MLDFQYRQLRIRPNANIVLHVAHVGCLSGLANELIPTMKGSLFKALQSSSHSRMFSEEEKEGKKKGVGA